MASHMLPYWSSHEIFALAFDMPWLDNQSIDGTHKSKGNTFQFQLATFMGSIAQSILR